MEQKKIAVTNAQDNHMSYSSLQMMDITSLKAVLADLREKIVPSRFEKVQQSNPHTLQMAFRTLENLTWVEINWHADSPRIVEINAPPQIDGESTLSKQIKFGTKGMALIELKQPGFDRVIEFCLAFRPKGDVQKSIILEIMGRHSNILLLNQNRQVIALGKQIRDYQSRLRPISTGDNYISPPPLKGRRPSLNESFQDWRRELSIVNTSLKNALTSTYQGISPSLLLQLANDNKESALKLINLNVKELSEKDWIEIYSRWKKWIKTLEEETFCLCFKGPTPYRVWKPSSSSSEKERSPGLLLGKYYKDFLEKRILSTTVIQFLKELNNRKESEKKALIKQEVLYAKTTNALSLKEKADRILCIKEPSKQKVLEAQRLYQKSKKIKRSKNILLERINLHKEKIKYINETELFLEYITNNTDDNRIKKIENICNLKEDIAEYLCLKKPQKNIIRNSKNNKIGILILNSPSGLEIQIGKNHNQNDLISLKKARKGDIWFHAQECPGSHVVIKGSHGNLENTDIQVGADLASFFSRAKRNKTVAVMMVETNQLKKPKGSPPGMVSPRDFKVIWGNPSNGEKYFDQSTKKD